MNIANAPISRRAFLRGTGVSLALPFLDAMWPQRMLAAQAAAPKRLVAVCTSLGIYGPALFPKETGRGYKASMYSEVIDEFRDQFTIFSGLSHPEVDGGHSSEASFLTAAAHPGASGFRNTISMDQLAIEKLAPDTRFSSLMLSSSSNYSLSWTRNGVNIPAEDRPSKVFAKLFLDGTACLLYTSPSPRDGLLSRMPSSA